MPGKGLGLCGGGGEGHRRVCFDSGVEVTFTDFIFLRALFFHPIYLYSRIISGFPRIHKIFTYYKGKSHVRDFDVNACLAARL